MSLDAVDSSAVCPACRHGKPGWPGHIPDHEYGLTVRAHCSQWDNCGTLYQTPAANSKDAYLENIAHWKLPVFGLRCLILVESARKFLGQFRSSGIEHSPGSAALRFVVVQSLFAATPIFIGCASTSWNFGHRLLRGVVA